MSMDELEALRRWKVEALEVISGLQFLGRALGLRPGTTITGPAAVEAVEKLRADLERAEQRLSTARAHRTLNRLRAERAEAKVARVEEVDFAARRLGMASPDPWREGWNRALEVAQDDLRTALSDGSTTRGENDHPD